MIVSNRKTAEDAKLVARADKLVGDYIKARDGHKCVKCGKNGKVYSAHILPKGKYTKLRFEPHNLMTMCLNCHLGSDGWHKNPGGSMEWFDKKYPGRYQELLIMDRMAARVNVRDVIAQFEAVGA